MNPTDNNLTHEQKNQMLAWVEQAAGRMPWWDNCAEPAEARAFVTEHLPHLLEA